MADEKEEKDHDGDMGWMKKEVGCVETRKRIRPPSAVIRLVRGWDGETAFWDDLHIGQGKIGVGSEKDGEPK